MELNRNGIVKATELIQTDNHQTLHRDGTIEFNDFNETSVNNEIVNIKRSGEITAKEFQENLEEVPVMAGLYYNAIEETWFFKKDERTPEYNPYVELYLMIETRGRQGFTVSRGSFPKGGTVMNPNTEMFISIDSVLRGDEESLDVTNLVNRALQRKDFKEDSFKEGRRSGVRYNVDTKYDNLKYVLEERSYRGMPKGTHKSKGYHYTKMRFIIGYFAEGGITEGKHRKYQWGERGKFGPDVGQVFKIYYKLNTLKPNTKEIDFLKKQIIVNK